MGTTVVALALTTVIVYGLLAQVPQNGQAVLFCGCIILYLTQVVKKKNTGVTHVFPDPMSFFAQDQVPVAPAPAPQPRVVVQAAPQAAQVVQPAATAYTDPYQQEAEILQELLTKEYKLACRVYDKPFKAPTYVGYRFEPLGSTTLDMVDRVLETLSTRLSGMDHRIAMGGNRAVHVVLERGRPAILQVTRPVVRPVSWDDRLKWSRSQKSAVFGSVTRYPGVDEPIVVPLDDDDHTTALFIGTMGSGKSTLAQAGLISLMERNSPDRLQVSIVDITGSFFVPFVNSAHVVECADNATGAKTIIENFSAFCEDVANDDSPVCRMLIIDEWAKLAEKNKALIDTLVGIMLTGRKKNVRVWVLTPQATLKNVPTEMKDAFQVVFVNYMDREDYTKDQLHIGGASSIERRVESIVRMDGQTRRFNTFGIDKERVRSEAGRLPQRTTPLTFVDTAEVTQSVEKAAPAPVDNSLRARVMGLRGNPEAYHRDRMTANRVLAILFPGKGKGEEYREISDILKEYYSGGEDEG